MKLHEYQSKTILARYGIRVPVGGVAETSADVRTIAQRIAGPVVIKSQVLIGGRGRRGAVRPSHSPEAAERTAADMLGSEIKGMRVRSVLVEQAVDAAKEMYLGLTVDDRVRQLVMLACAEGGVDIEDVARGRPDRIVRETIDPFLGLQAFQGRGLAWALKLDRSLWPAFAAVAHRLYEAFVDCDCVLAEINPLVLTADGHLVAVDAKIELDDYALFRQPGLAALRDAGGEDQFERQAREWGLSYVRLDGEISCIANGAGLGMASMDAIRLLGGTCASFLDLGGGAQPDRVAFALRQVLSDEGCRVVLVNIFGGVTRCDDVARGIVRAMGDIGAKIPIIVRLAGTNEAAGRRILARANVITATSLGEAAQKAVAASRSGPLQGALQ